MLPQEWLTHKISDRLSKAALAVNLEVVSLYWEIGCVILQRQTTEGWGTKVIDRLSLDLRNAFPGMKGFSPRNLKYMRKFAEEFPGVPIVQQPAAQLPWTHLCLLLDKVKDPEVRAWYIKATIDNGWGRDTLALQVTTNLNQRQVVVVKTTNFQDRLPHPQSHLAQQTLKDPYVFDFLTQGQAALERDLENGLVDHITKFLLELGAGFAFVGRQVHMEVAQEDFYLDLLFYHLKLRCYVVVDLKGGAFKPEYTGKMNFYLSAVDATLRHPDDAPSIGIILCRDKKRLIAEYALKDMVKPMGVAEWQTRLVESLPEAFKGSLPTIEELEAGLSESDEPA
jgi:predicted nuclease of restriction endonuclease-like (RecB) superfamily